MYSVRQDLMLQSVFRGKERLTLIQFSFLKTRGFGAFPKLLLLFCVQFSNHAPDVSLKSISFPFFFVGSPLVRISVCLPSFGFEGNHSFYGPLPYVRFVGR